jgi:hypothetical protein
MVYQIVFILPRYTKKHTSFSVQTQALQMKSLGLSSPFVQIPQLIVKLLEHLIQVNLLNCGHLMIRGIDLVKQECAAVARLGNLESKPRYSHRLTNDIHGTGPFLKCRLSVSRSNTRLIHPTVHQCQCYVTS